MPALPLWLTTPLWDQFVALLPEHPEFDPTHPLGCHRRRIPDRVVFDKLLRVLRVLRFGCSYEGIADTTCGHYDPQPPRRMDHARGIRAAEDDRPGRLRPHRRSRRKQGMKRSLMVEGHGIPLGRVLAGANRHDSPLLAPTLDTLDDLGPLPGGITVHLDSGYDFGKTRDELAIRGLHGQIAHKGEKAPIQASRRWHVERTNSWHNAFNRLQRWYERREAVIDAFFDLADAIITVRALIRRAWTLYRWDTRPRKRP